MRIGANWGSLDRELLAISDGCNSRRAEPGCASGDVQALIASAIDSALQAERMGLVAARSSLSRKVNGVQDLISVYREFVRAAITRCIWG